MQGREEGNLEEKEEVEKGGRRDIWKEVACLQGSEFGKWVVSKEGKKGECRGVCKEAWID